MATTASWAGGNAAVDEARQDLAKRLQVGLDQIAVVSQVEKTWPDGSMGCPRKGMVYKQVLTNGSELILEVAGKRYAYHSAVGKPYFYCPVPAKKRGPQ